MTHLHICLVARSPQWVSSSPVLHYIFLSSRARSSLFQLNCLASESLVCKWVCLQSQWLGYRCVQPCTSVICAEVHICNPVTVELQMCTSVQVLHGCWGPQVLVFPQQSALPTERSRSSAFFWESGSLTGTWNSLIRLGWLSRELGDLPSPLCCCWQ